MTATALPFGDDLSVDHDAYAGHCRWLVDSGCDGVVPNGSLGEYQTLTPEERAGVVETAVAAVGGDRVMPGSPRTARGRPAAGPSRPGTPAAAR
nr:hypothetical protein GCM10020093_028720 [Planobispora longispora]